MRPSVPLGDAFGSSNDDVPQDKIHALLDSGGLALSDIFRVLVEDKRRDAAAGEAPQPDEARVVAGGAGCQGRHHDAAGADEAGVSQYRADPEPRYVFM